MLASQRQLASVAAKVVLIIILIIILISKCSSSSKTYDDLMTILLSDASPHLCQWQSLQGSWQERCFFSDFSHYHHCQCHSHCPDPPKNHCSEKITAKVAVVTASTEGIG